MSQIDTLYIIIKSSFITKAFLSVNIHLMLCRYPFQDNQVIHSRDWQLYLKEMAQMIIKEQSPEMFVVFVSSNHSNQSTTTGVAMSLPL